MITADDGVWNNRAVNSNFFKHACKNNELFAIFFLNFWSFLRINKQIADAQSLLNILVLF